MAKRTGKIPTHKPLAAAVSKSPLWYEAKSKRPLIESYTENLATMQVADILGEKRLSGLADLTQKESDKAMSFVAQEEATLQKLLVKSYLDGDRGLKIILEEYINELSQIYYASRSVEVNPFNDDNLIQTEYLPTLSLIINALKIDPAFDAEPLKPAQKSLLDYANKIKIELESRISLEGKLKGSLSKLMGSDVVMGALAGAATRNPIIALGVFAYQQSKKKNDYAEKFKIQRKKFQLASKLEGRRAQPEVGTKDITPGATEAPTPTPALTPTPASSSPATAKEITLGGNPTASRAERRREHEQVWSASDGMKKTVTIGGSASSAEDALAEGIGASVSSGKTEGAGGQIIEILNRHTTLLEKIYGVDAEELKLKRDELAKNLADREESNLETQNPSASQLNLPFGEGKEDEGGGWISSLLRIASGFLPVGRIGRVLMAGKGGLLTRLASSRIGGAITARGAGMMATAGGALGLGGATATKVGGEATQLGLNFAEGAIGKAAPTATKAASPLAEITSKVSTKLGQTTVGKAAGAGAVAIKSAIAKRIPGVVKQILGKSVPGLGAIIGTGFALKRLWNDPTDVVGALGEVGSGLGGIMTALAIQIPLFARDVYTDLNGTFPENDVVRYGASYVGEKLTEIKNQVAAAFDEQLVELGIKDNKENEKRTKEADQQAAATQQQSEQQATSGTETPSTAPTTPDSSTPPVSAPAPKRSFLRRLGVGILRSAAAVVTGGMSELALSAYNKGSASKQGGGRSGGAGASGSWNGDLTQVLEFGGESGQLQNFKGLHPVIQNKVIQAAQEYFQKTGKKLKVNSAKRDSAKQQQLWDESVKAGRPGRGPNGMAIAKPGRSRHERGLAIDIQNYRDPIAVAALNKQGLFQGVPGDPVHFQLDGNPSLDQLATANDAQSSSMGAPATAPNTSSPVGAAPSGNLPGSPSTPATAALAGDTNATGRDSITKNISRPTNPAGSGGGGNGNVSVVRGGDTVISSGGGGSNAAQIIPAPIDREPTIRRILDGSLS